MFQDDICSEGYVNVGPCGLLSGRPTNCRLFMQTPTKDGQYAQTGSGGDLSFTATYVRWL